MADTAKITGPVTVKAGLCDFCGTCVGICPADAIELKEFSIRFDSERCTLCGFCEDICPLGALEVKR
jgi:ferredoxin